jgi:hypothetical protein
MEETFKGKSERKMPHVPRYIYAVAALCLIVGIIIIFSMYYIQSNQTHVPTKMVPTTSTITGGAEQLNGSNNYKIPCMEQC